MTQRPEGMDLESFVQNYVRGTDRYRLAKYALSLEARVRALTDGLPADVTPGLLAYHVARLSDEDYETYKRILGDETAAVFLNTESPEAGLVCQ